MQTIGDDLWHSVHADEFIVSQGVGLSPEFRNILSKLRAATSTDVVSALVRTGLCGSGGRAVAPAYTCCTNRCPAADGPVCTSAFCIDRRPWLQLKSGAVAPAEFAEVGLGKRPFVCHRSLVAVAIPGNRDPRGLLIVGDSASNRDWSQADQEALTDAAHALVSALEHVDDVAAERAAVATPVPAMVIQDPERNPLIYVNQAFLSMFGYSSAKEISDNDFDVWLDPYEVYLALKVCLERGSWTGTRVCKKRDGTLFEAAVASRMVRAGAHAAYLTAVYTDLSPLKQTEALLLRRTTTGQSPSAAPSRNELPGLSPELADVRGRSSIDDPEFARFQRFYRSDLARIILAVTKDEPGRHRTGTDAGRIAGLSAKEAEVAELIAMGFPAIDIAARLFISINTVKTHRRHVFAKLGIRKATALSRRLAELRSSD